MLIRELLKDESDFIVQRRGKGRGEEGQEITCEKAIKSNLLNQGIISLGYSWLKKSGCFIIPSIND